MMIYSAIMVWFTLGVFITLFTKGIAFGPAYTPSDYRGIPIGDFSKLTLKILFGHGLLLPISLMYCQKQSHPYPLINAVLKGHVCMFVSYDNLVHATGSKE